MNVTVRKEGTMKRKLSIILAIAIMLILVCSCGNTTGWSFDKSAAEKVKVGNVSAYIPNDWITIEGEGEKTDYGTTNLIYRGLFDGDDGKVEFAIEYMGEFDSIDTVLSAFGLKTADVSKIELKGCDSAVKQNEPYVNDDWCAYDIIAGVDGTYYYIYEGYHMDYQNDEAFDALLATCNFDEIDAIAQKANQIEITDEGIYKNGGDKSINNLYKKFQNIYYNENYKRCANILNSTKTENWPILLVGSYDNHIDYDYGTSSGEYSYTTGYDIFNQLNNIGFDQIKIKDNDIEKIINFSFDMGEKYFSPNTSADPEFVSLSRIWSSAEGLSEYGRFEVLTSKDFNLPENMKEALSLKSDEEVDLAKNFYKRQQARKEEYSLFLLYSSTGQSSRERMGVESISEYEFLSAQTELGENDFTTTIKFYSNGIPKTQTNTYDIEKDFYTGVK